MSKGALAAKTTANLNVRVEKISHEMLQAIAAELGTSMNTVVNAVFEYALAPQWLQMQWTEHVDAVRDMLLEAGQDHSSMLYDFTADEWAAKEAFYDRLEQVGMIEDLRSKHSVNFANRVICSFRLTMTGRVIAAILQQAGGFAVLSERLKQPSELPHGGIV